MLQQAVIFAGIALVFSSIVLFAAGGHIRRAHWLLSLALIAGLSALSWTVCWALLRASLPFSPTVAISVGLGAIIAALFDTWNPAGHAAFTAITGAALVFLAYVSYVIFAAHLGPWSTAFACLLLLLQIGTLVLLLGNMFEIVDVVCRSHWNCVYDRKPTPSYTPKVSLHVPVHAEPPELVIETLDALAALDYPDYEVLVVDNNTADEYLWRPVEQHCRRLGERFRFFHLMPWPGYKSGALNFALSQTSPEAEIVGIVDADYVVEPTFLADLVGHFANPEVAFVQTPQDYRDHVERGRYGRALYLAYLYFFQVSMATRNEYNGIIFAGTMGLIRRASLVRAGGWDEWCVTEDAELSLRLLDAGHKSVYVPRTYGRGIMPLDYAGLKKQRFRWAFGGMQILRLHAGRLFNPRSTGKLTWAQRFSYLNGGLQWLNDPLALAFTVVLLVGSGALLFGRPLQSQPLAGATMLMPPLFILFAVMRFLWAFRLRAKCSWREATDALTILLGLTWVVAIACLRGLTSKQGVFLRTPKQADRPTLGDAVRVVLLELFVGTTCFVIAAALIVVRPGGMVSAKGLVIVMLVWQCMTYQAAIVSSAWSYAEGRPATRRGLFTVFHNLGHRTGRFVTEPRAAVPVGIMLVSVLLLFHMGRTRAPLMERVGWANPLGQFLPSRSLVQPPSDAAAVTAGVLVKEADAARRGDVASALKLWAPDGVIVDADFKSQPSSSDRTWAGMEELQLRYVREFQQRHYKSLQHLNLKIEFEGNTAIITNDLTAVFDSGNVRRRVRLPSGDRWVLRQDPEGWRIVRLEVNRVPERGDSQTANNRVEQK